LDFTEEGTDAASVASVGWVGITVVGSEGLGAVVEDEAAVVVGLLELLEQAAPRTATAPMTVATAAFLNPRWVGMTGLHCRSSSDGKV
jgi:hypothetical protein